MSNNFRVYFNRFRRNCCLKKRTVEANNIDHENLFHLIGWMHIASQTFYWRKSILRQSALRFKHSHRKFFLNEEHFEPTLTYKNQLIFNTYRFTYCSCYLILYKLLLFAINVNILHTCISFPLLPSMCKVI